MNDVHLFGHIGKDPEMRHTQNGKQVCSFTLATNEGFGDNQRVTWHNIVAWGKLAPIAVRFHKGSKVYINGRIDYRTAERDGQKRYYTDIVASLIIGGESEQLGGGDDDDSEIPF
jgi:single-strand DNA-binding protein